MDGDMVPAKHLRQTVIPEAFVYDPVAQFVQTEEPALLLNKPTPQAMHAFTLVAPLVFAEIDEYILPAKHLRQTDIPLALVYDPAAQFLQTEEPALLLYESMPQVMHPFASVAPLAVAYVPTVQL
jgi:hypothetical protein